MSLSIPFETKNTSKDSVFLGLFEFGILYETGLIEGVDTVSIL